jgi:hypothetical protein
MREGALKQSVSVVRGCRKGMAIELRGDEQSLASRSMGSDLVGNTDRAAPAGEKGRSRDFMRLVLMVDRGLWAMRVTRPGFRSEGTG